MEKKLFITYSDNLGMVCVEVDQYGIRCDGTRMIFSDANEREYTVPVENVFSIVMD